MKLNIIYDSRLLNRYDPLMKELSSQGIKDYDIWPCLIYPDVINSISESHKMIVEDAKERRLKEVCIAEDDLQFTAPGAWDFFIKNKPEIYDLYLACTYADRSLKQTCGFHLYCVHEQFYDKFLSAPRGYHIDTAMWFLGGPNFHFCYPYPAIQRPGFSSNNRSYSDYNAVLKEGDLFA